MTLDEELQGGRRSTTELFDDGERLRGRRSADAVLHPGEEDELLGAVAGSEAAKARRGIAQVRVEACERDGKTSSGEGSARVNMRSPSGSG